MKLFLLCNVLVLAAYPLTLAWRLPPRTRLWLTRASLLCCVAAPVILYFAPPIRAPKAIFESVSVDAVGDSVARLPEKIGEKLEASSAPGVESLDVLKSLFLAGLAAGGARLARDARRLQRILKTGVSLRHQGLAQVLVSGDIEVPFSFRGLHKKYVVLPVSMLNRPFDMRLAVSHESQHHRQWDCLWVYPQELLRLVFFVNPIIHVWLKRIGELQELSCDEQLVRRRYSPAEYAGCLVRVAQSVANHRVACAVGMATRPFIHRRIAMLSDYQKVVSRKVWLSLTAFVVALVPTLALANALVNEPTARGFDGSHLDARVQKIATEEARSALKSNKATSAAVVVVDPSSGNVLAFAEAGTPGWDRRQVPTGSVVKPLLFEAAMKAGLVTPETMLDCHGPLSIEGHTYTDYEPSEMLSAKDTLAKSSNIGAIRISQKLGLAGLNAALAAFGLKETQMQGDADAVRVAKVSFGQTVQTTLFDIARAYAVLASRGSDEIRELLTYAVANGTGSRAQVRGVSVAGKTGTVELKTPQGSDIASKTVLASFVGFAPSTDPRYVIFTIVENPQGPAKTGGMVAAPVFERVASRSLKSK